MVKQANFALKCRYISTIADNQYAFGWMFESNYVNYVWGFPGGSSGKESACQSQRHWSDPWFGKIPWRRKWQPTPVFLPEKSHGQRRLVGLRRVRHWLSMHAYICVCICVCMCIFFPNNDIWNSRAEITFLRARSLSQILLFLPKLLPVCLLWSSPLWHILSPVLETSKETTEKLQEVLVQRGKCNIGT